MLRGAYLDTGHQPPQNCVPGLRGHPRPEPGEVLRIIRTIHGRPEGLTAAWDATKDRVRVERSDFLFSPATGILRASTASDDDVDAALRRFVAA
ncbi:hypothetical protein MTS1_01092 [Microbacterium sp. TS-1]|nr:hypothetical protein MTS1_01092 [Microbacterium sp. TS-1]